MNQCRKCGNTLKQNNDFCTTCGEPATTVGKLKKWLNGNFLLKSMLKIAFGTFCVVFFITLIIRVLPTISPSPATPAIQPHTQMQTIQPAPSDTVWNVYDRESWNTALAAIRNSGNNRSHLINVTGNFSVPGKTEYTFGTLTDIKITFSGNNTISLSGAGSLLIINSEQTVILRDLDLIGYINNKLSLVQINNGTFTLHGNSSLTGNTTTGNGGGVTVTSNGNFTMHENSSIFGNTAAYDGGGIFARVATIKMNDNATVYGNAGRSGGGIGIRGGSFIMRGNASVFGNIATGPNHHGGGGVFASMYYVVEWRVSDSGGPDAMVVRTLCRGTFTMHDNSSVFGNIAINSGGGVSVASATFIMHDNSSVSGNTAINNNGGGVFISTGGTFTKTGGTIHGNNAPANIRNTTTQGNGHAVFQATPRRLRNTTADLTMNTNTAGFWEN